MKWKTKQLFLILVILHWPFHTLPQAHMCTIESTHTHHMMKLTQLACTTTHLQMQIITEVRTTDVHLPCSMFWRALFSCLADSPLGSSISQHPWLSPSKQWRLQGLGPRLWSSHSSLKSQGKSKDFLQRVSLCSHSPGELSQVIYESEWIAEQNSVPLGTGTDPLPVTLLLFWETQVMKNLSLCDIQYLQWAYTTCCEQPHSVRKVPPWQMYLLSSISQPSEVI